jgi:hypothetical protein
LSEGLAPEVIFSSFCSNASLMVCPKSLQFLRLVDISVLYAVEVDGLDDRPDKHSNWSLITGGHGPYIPFPSHSFLASLGPQTWILMLDCR